MYRDAGNHKFYCSEVFQGSLLLVDLKMSLHEHDYFVPSLVGLRDLQPEVKNTDDHIWHEIVEVILTDEAPTTSITADDLVARFEIAKKTKWEMDLDNFV